MDLDSVLLGRREAGRDELLERICIDQVRRWRAGQRVPAETYLAKYPAVQRDDEAIFELIYGEFLLREERGEPPSADELRWRFPRHAERLRRQVDLHELLNSTDGGDGPGPAGGGAEPDESPELEGPVVAPGFRIVGELGRGGMGTVYKAWQLSLKRFVAIKVLRMDAYADAGATARFQSEAEAAARFQHPNIVQVYEVGEHDGLGYLVLEYAAGGGLDRRLAESLQDPRSSARLIETLARAIHFAHERGIIHRDLKPANVLLTEDGVPKITDFGLAKLLEREEELTAHGEILGTPSYMAPEQVRGQTDKIRPATDVYSLGAILYEMLTGRPPFKGTTPLSTLEQVSSQEPLSPGKIQRNVPRDLETICLKCLNKEPGRRYATASELAEDLDRFLHGRPILARPTPLWDRLAKWARRRPLSAAAVAGLFTLSVILLVGAVYYNHRLHVEMLAALRAERRAQDERDLALNAFNRLIYDVQERLAQTPATRALRRSLLDTAIRGLEELERSAAGGSPNLSQAVAYQKLGDIFRVIFKPEMARIHYRRSLQIAGALLSGHPDPIAVQEVLYLAQMGLGHVDMRAKQYDAAKVGFHKAVAMAETIAAAKPDSDAARRDLIEACLQLGRAQQFSGESSDAEVWYRKMHDLARRWVAESPGNNQARDLLASALRKLGDMRKLFDRDLPAARGAARRAYTQAIAIGREIVAADPENDAYQNHLAYALDDLAGVARDEGGAEEARSLFVRAEQLFAGLVARDPENLELRLKWLQTRYRLAKLDRQESRYEEARAALTRIRDEWRDLGRDGRLEGQREVFTSERELDQLINECAKGLRKSG
jgi:serine/threonine protein kinase